MESFVTFDLRRLFEIAQLTEEIHRKKLIYDQIFIENSNKKNRLGSVDKQVEHILTSRHAEVDSNSFS